MDEPVSLNVVEAAPPKWVATFVWTCVTAIMALAVALLFGVYGLRDRSLAQDRISDLERELQCRGDSNALLAKANADATAAGHELLIATAIEFQRRLLDEAPDVDALRRRIALARQMVDRQIVAASRFQAVITACGEKEE